MLKLGVHEIAAPGDTMARYPGARWGREFVAGKGGLPLPASTTEAQLIAQVSARLTPWVRAGGGCVVSVKLDLPVVATGVWDARLTGLGKALTGLNVVVVVNHEPEDDLTAAGFAAGFTAARTALKAGWAGLDVAYCAMAWQWRPGSKTTADAAAWAAVDADLYLVDAYSGQSFPPTAILPEHPGFQRWWARIVGDHPGRRWGVAERGWQTGPGRASTIGREADWLTTDPVGRTCEMYVVWSTPGVEANRGWVADTGAEGAIRDLIARLATRVVTAGYTATDDPAVLVHDATGALVAADRTAAWTAFYARQKSAEQDRGRSDDRPNT
jgi:hypothetical protein